jgi:hypothetical protein
MQNKSMQRQSADPAAGLLLAQIIRGLGQAIMLTVEVFLHRGFGRRYVVSGLAGIVVMIFFAGCFNGQHCNPLFCYTAAYSVLWLIAGISTLKRCWRDNDKVHSRYTGRPYICSLLPNWKEDNVKNLEALAVVLLGFGIHYMTPPLGDYLMLAAGLMLVRRYCHVIQQRDRLIAMNDQAIEQRIVAERFRDMQGQ